MYTCKWVWNSLDHTHATRWLADLNSQPSQSRILRIKGICVLTNSKGQRSSIHLLQQGTKAEFQPSVTLSTVDIQPWYTMKTHSSPSTFRSVVILILQLETTEVPILNERGTQYYSGCNSCICLCCTLAMGPRIWALAWGYTPRYSSTWSWNDHILVTWPQLASFPGTPPPGGERRLPIMWLFASACLDFVMQTAICCQTERRETPIGGNLQVRT